MAAPFPQGEAALFWLIGRRLPPQIFILLACGSSQDVTFSADARPPPRYRPAGHFGLSCRGVLTAATLVSGAAAALTGLRYAPQ